MDVGVVGYVVIKTKAVSVSTGGFTYVSQLRP